MRGQMRSGLVRMTRRELVLGAAAAPLAARAAFAAGQARPKMAAFVVGLNNYRNISKLDRAVPDAQAIARTLAGPHYGYDVELAIDVDADGFLQAQRRFLEKLVDGRGAAFCYIAGHEIGRAHV